eukprot:9083439-Pyramimonas_sp.AAC.1
MLATVHTSLRVTSPHDVIDIASSNIRRLTMSTSFSGIGAPEVACDTLYHALCAFSDDTIRVDHTDNTHRPRCLFGVEIDAAARAELKLLPHGPECVFYNVVDFFRDSHRDFICAHASTLTAAHFEDLVMSGNLTRRHAACCIHGMACELHRADIHIAGTPCPDWSPQQNQRLGEHGPTSLAYYAWCATRRLIQEPGILHENVPEFPVSCLERVLQGTIS